MIGGTSESRKLIDRIKDLENFVITVATVSGKEFIQGSNLHIGRMGYKDMVKFIAKNNISLIVDLTHPYAEEVTENAKKVAAEKDIRYIRYIRRKVGPKTKAIYLKNYEEAYDYISKLQGTIFFTTGSKNIGDFENIRGENRFIYRVLPALESIEICRKYDIKLRDIVAVLGPFTKDFNKAMFKEYQVDYVVMKDSGDEGGTLEKIKACEELGIIPIVVGREMEEGYDNLDAIEEIIRRHKDEKFL
ncbi:precorrin-6A reductase [Tepidimicrobium xylanilyticum]